MFDTLHDLLSNNWVYGMVMFIYVATIATIILAILSENRHPVKSLAWVTVLFLLPVAGVVLYIFFGRSIKNTHMISRRNRRRLRRRERHHRSPDPKDCGYSAESVQQINLGRSLTGAQFYYPNTVETFTDGKSKFEAMLADIRAARHSINIQYYIFEDDRIGGRMAEALIAKAREGVTVRMIYDHVGSFKMSSSFFKRLRAEGVEAHPFFKVSFPQLATRINWRNHRKICVIDGTTGYLGGMNVADRYVYGTDRYAPWRDTHVRVRGPVVAAMQYSFTVDWQFMGGGLIEDEPPGAGAVSPKLLAGRRAAIPEVGNVGMQMLTSGPTSQWSNIAFAFHKAIAGAKRRVYVQTPYFLPTEGLMKSLQTAALSHVDVRLMIPDKSDSAMLTYASDSSIEECLKAGIKVYRYKAGMLHAKTIVVDDEFVTIGSTNFDFRSFEFNFESNLFFYSRDYASQMIELFRRDMKECERVTPAEWRRRPVGHKMAESIIRLLSPIL